jgi:hypothetical protein
MHSQKSRFYFLFPILGLIVIACMILPIPVPVPAPIPIRVTKINHGLPPTTYDGNWEGTTSQQAGITFTVKYNDIVNLSIKGNLTGQNCNYEFNFGNGSVPTTEAPEYYFPINPIEKGKFSITSDSAGISYVIAGTFLTSTSASGTMKISDTNRNCKGSVKIDWSASKTLDG